MKNLITELNKFDFQAFVRKDGKGTSLTVKGEDGKRYFLTRVSTGVNADGSASYGWARGNAMRDIEK